MSVAAELPAHAGPWTVADVLAIPEDAARSRHELIDGALVVSPAPALPHQLASSRLWQLLAEATSRAGAAVTVYEAVNVQVPAGLVIPDISVVDNRSDENAIVLAAADVHLVVEIVSPTSTRMDHLVKPSVYAEAGIPAYWRLVLRPAPTLTTYRLHHDQYIEQTVVPAGRRTELHDPYPLVLDPATLARR
ncbi:MAG TPA: Uma2 family endonuclease [Frankiaceae bacterium]|nr:Uma2 family endonuclease [Frankiaceae bacterium]